MQLKAEVLLFLFCLFVSFSINKLFKYPLKLGNMNNRELVFCSRVIDGDTVVVRSGSKKFRVRLLGIDTPEINWKDKNKTEKWALEASEYLRAEVEDKNVLLELEEPFTDVYGRVLAYLYTMDGRSLNSSILREGYGRVDLRFPCEQTEELLSMEAIAREKNLGIWSK